jgi:hypothetical protein
MKKMTSFRNRFKSLKCCADDLSHFTSQEIQSYSSLINTLMRKIFAKSCYTLILFFCFNSYAQNDSIFYKTHSQIFSLSPISKKVDKVNGLVFGVGHFENSRIDKQTINGLNIEVNGAPIAGAFVGFLSIMYLPEVIKNNNVPITGENDFEKNKGLNTNLKLKINGINISTGCFFTSTSMNGLNISVGNIYDDFNGVSITGIGNISNNHNGIAIGLFNGNNNLKGMNVGVFNVTYELKGIHLGVINYVKINKGVQVGIFNRSYSKGLQVGLWNVNKKRSFPFINW